MLVQGKLRRTGLCSINDHNTNYRLINKDTPKNLLLELRVWGRGQKVGVGGSKDSGHMGYGGSVFNPSTC